MTLPDILGVVSSQEKRDITSPPGLPFHPLGCSPMREYAPRAAVGESFEKTRFLWDALSEEERRRIKDKRREGLGGWEIISVLVGGFLVLQGERLQGVRFQGD